MKFRDFSPTSHIALYYDNVVYHITVRQMAPDRFRAEWVRPHAEPVQATGSTRLAAQARLVMKIDPANVHVVRDIHGKQLA